MKIAGMAKQIEILGEYGKAWEAGKARCSRLTHHSGKLYAR